MLLSAPFGSKDILCPWLRKRDANILVHDNFVLLRKRWKCFVELNCLRRYYALGTRHPSVKVGTGHRNDDASLGTPFRRPRESTMHCQRIEIQRLFFFSCPLPSADGERGVSGDAGGPLVGGRGCRGYHPMAYCQEGTLPRPGNARGWQHAAKAISALSV